MKYAHYLLILIILAAVMISAGCVAKSGTEIPSITGPWTEASSIVHQNGDEGFTYPALTNGIFDVTFQEGRLFSGTFAGTDFHGSFYTKDGTQFILINDISETEQPISEILIGTIVSDNEIRISGVTFQNTNNGSVFEESTSGARSFTLVRNGAALQPPKYPDVLGMWEFDNGSVTSRITTIPISGGDLIVQGQEEALFYGIIDMGSQTGPIGYTNFTAVMYGGNKIKNLLFITDEGQLWFGTILAGEISLTSIDDKTSESTVNILTQTYRKDHTVNYTLPVFPDVTGIWSTKQQEVISENGYDTGLPSDFIISADVQNHNCFIGSTSYMGVNEGEIGGIVSTTGEVTLFKYNKNGGIYLAMGQIDEDTFDLSEIFTDAGTTYISRIITVRT